MTAPGSTTIASPTAADAREELCKFFALAAMADRSPGMFSRFIDEDWHRLAETAEYTAFCGQTAGVPVRHDATCGEGVVRPVAERAALSSA